MFSSAGHYSHDAFTRSPEQQDDLTLLLLRRRDSSAPVAPRKEGDTGRTDH